MIINIDFQSKITVMTSVVSNPNISPFGDTPLSQVFSRKRKFKSFNLTSVMNSVYPQYDDYSDYDTDQPQYEYYDAAGRPYTDTIIRPISLFQQHLLNPPTLEIDHPALVQNWQPSYTCLKTDVTCPASFVKNFPTWEQAVEEHNKYLCEVEHEKKMESFVEFNEKIDKVVIEQEHIMFMSRLPKFSKAYLAKMEKAKRKPTVSSASSKFYDRKPTSSSRTAWGHRRNGGGKGKKIERMVAMPGQMSQKYLTKCVWDDKYKGLIVSADEEAKRMRKVKREYNKEKCKIETEKRAERLLEMEKVKMENQAVVEPQEKVEETEYQKFLRGQMDKMRTAHLEKIKEQDALKIPVVKKSFEELGAESVKECTPVRVENTASGWSTVRTKITTNKERIEKQLTVSLYSRSCGSTSRGSAMKKMAEMKKGGQFSRLCKSVLNNTRCPHGTRCKFAHTPEQLNISDCVFGDRCNHVSYVDGKWTNTGRKMCSFAHPGEEQDKMLFCQRIGMKKPVEYVNPKVVNAKPSDQRIAKPVVNTKRVNPWGDKPVMKPMKKTRWGPPKQHVFKVNKQNVAVVAKHIYDNKLENVKVVFV